MTGVGVLLALILLICVNIILFYKNPSRFLLHLHLILIVTSEKIVTLEKAVRSNQESGREIQQLSYAGGQENI